MAAKEEEAARLIAEANERARQLEEQLAEKEREAQEKAREEHGVTPENSQSLGGAKKGLRGLMGMGKKEDKPADDKPRVHAPGEVWKKHKNSMLLIRAVMSSSAQTKKELRVRVEQLEGELKVAQDQLEETMREYAEYVAKMENFGDEMAAKDRRMSALE